MSHALSLHGVQAINKFSSFHAGNKLRGIRKDDHASKLSNHLE